MEITERTIGEHGECEDKSAFRIPQSAIRILGIAGTSSNVGKTSLIYRLLRELSRDEAWEAIKLTRGHYRSCGKDPHACCVSHLLSDQPVVRSGREATYVFGKDTGVFWDGGADNVHWVIVTNDQVEQGIRQALERVRTGNVLIEGTSFLKYFKADFAILVARSDRLQLKPSARQALLNGLVDAIYLSGDGDGEMLRSQFSSSVNAEGGSAAIAGSLERLPIYTKQDFPGLVDRIREIATETQRH
jgi:molybdopterin-guanine dinucleotide biosynthesis protein